jgi:hypothetical protein
LAIETVLKSSVAAPQPELVVLVARLLGYDRLGAISKVRSRPKYRHWYTMPESKIELATFLSFTISYELKSAMPSQAFKRASG